MTTQRKWFGGTLLCLILLCACGGADDFSAETDPVGKSRMALHSRNGHSINGHSINGISIAGQAIQSLTSVSLLGPKLAQGGPLDRLILVGSSLRTAPSGGYVKVSPFNVPPIWSTANNVVLRAASTVAREGEDDLEVQVTGWASEATDNGQPFFSYDVGVRRLGDVAFAPLCPSGERAVAVAGVWNYGVGAGGGAKTASDTRFTLSCKEGAVAKCMRRYGYLPWRGEEYDRHHQACVRAIRADFCGNGFPGTVDGTTIDLFDNDASRRPGVDSYGVIDWGGSFPSNWPHPVSWPHPVLGVNANVEGDGFFPEAQWNEDGPICIYRQRLSLRAEIQFQGKRYQSIHDYYTAECPSRLANRVVSRRDTVLGDSVLRALRIELDRCFSSGRDCWVLEYKIQRLGATEIECPTNPSGPPPWDPHALLRTESSMSKKK